MKDRCCRSSPRCAGCPALAQAAQRRAGLSKRSQLVTEVLTGGTRRTLPATVTAALEQLHAGWPGAGGR